MELLLILSMRSLAINKKTKKYILNVQSIIDRLQCTFQHHFQHDRQYNYILWPCKQDNTEPIRIKMFQEMTVDGQKVLQKRGEATANVVYSYQGDVYQFNGVRNDRSVLYLEFKIQKRRLVQEKIDQLGIFQINDQLQQQIETNRKQNTKNQQYLDYTNRLLHTLLTPQPQHPKIRQKQLQDQQHYQSDQLTNTPYNKERYPGQEKSKAGSLLHNRANRKVINGPELSNNVYMLSHERAIDKAEQRRLPEVVEGNDHYQRQIDALKKKESINAAINKRREEYFNKNNQPNSKQSSFYSIQQSEQNPHSESIIQKQQYIISMSTKKAQRKKEVAKDSQRSQNKSSHRYRTISNDNSLNRQPRLIRPFLFTNSKSRQQQEESQPSQDANMKTLTVDKNMIELPVLNKQKESDGQIDKSIVRTYVYPQIKQLFHRISHPISDMDSHQEPYTEPDRPKRKMKSYSQNKSLRESQGNTIKNTQQVNLKMIFQSNMDYESSLSTFKQIKNYSLDIFNIKSVFFDKNNNPHPKKLILNSQGNKFQTKFMERSINSVEWPQVFHLDSISSQSYIYARVISFQMGEEGQTSIKVSDVVKVKEQVFRTYVYRENIISGYLQFQFEHTAGNNKKMPQQATQEEYNMVLPSRLDIRSITNNRPHPYESRPRQYQRNGNSLPQITKKRYLSDESKFAKSKDSTNERLQSFNQKPLPKKKTIKTTIDDNIYPVGIANKVIRVDRQNHYKEKLKQKKLKIKNPKFK